MQKVKQAECFTEVELKAQQGNSYCNNIIIIIILDVCSGASAM